MSFKYERLPCICYWCGCLTRGDKDCDLWITRESMHTVEDWKYGAWLRAPLFNQIRKSTTVVPGFYQQRKDSKGSKDYENANHTNNQQAAMTENGALVNPLQKVIPDSSLLIIANSISHPISGDLNDFPPGFGVQLEEKGNFAQTLHEIDEKLTKFDAMEGVDGNLEDLPNKESINPENPSAEDIHALSNSPLSVTCNISSLTHDAWSARLPLVDVSNSQDSLTCTPLPPKPSWTRINRVPSEIEVNLEVHSGKERAQSSKRGQQGLPKKTKLLSQVGKENEVTLAKAGSQPC